MKPNSERKGIYIYFLPNLFTSVNLAMGFLAIVASFNGDLEKAVYALFLGAIFDSLDGRVARMVNGESAFGEQFDSLADMVAFGVAPAIVTYIWALKPFGRAGYLVAFFFALCASLRLARFNVMTAVIPKSYFQGLPSPIAALTLVSSWLFFRDFELTHMAGPFVLALTIILSLLMVSTIRFASFKQMDLRQRQKMGVLFVVCLILILLFIRHETNLFITLMIYAATNIGLNLRRYLKRKREEDFSSFFYDENALLESDEEDVRETERTH